MARPVTMFTGQWADLPIEEICKKVSKWGYDGLELACWGDHFETDKALESDKYLKDKKALLEKYKLKCWAISTHLAGQCVCDDPIDDRHKGIIPPRIWGDGKPEGVRERAAQEVKDTAKAAAAFGVKIVNGFTGSKIWPYLAGFPPVPGKMLEAGYKDFADRWNPIIDAFDKLKVKFALEVHPSEIAYDFWTTQKTLDAIKRRPGFGINFDPSHLNWQMLDSVAFVLAYGDRIYHMHVKDSIRLHDGRNGALGSHLSFGDMRRGWDFVSPGHGNIPFERVFRALTSVGYQGPLSVEWEDCGMDREWGAQDALKFVRRTDFEASKVAFDAAFESKK
jgi:sugar phosphate isomerase/epimerase